MSKPAGAKSKAVPPAKKNGGSVPAKGRRAPPAPQHGIVERGLDIVRSLPPSHCAIVLCFMFAAWFTERGMPITRSVTLLMVACIAILVLEMLQMKRATAAKEHQLDEYFEERTNSLPHG